MISLKFKNFMPGISIIVLYGCSASVTKIENKKITTPASDSIAVKYEPVSDIAAIPVEMNEPEPGGSLFVTDATGEVWILKKDSMLAKPFFDRYGKLYKGSINSAPGRVYSIAFHPDYAVNHKFYVSYVEPVAVGKKTGKLVISQFTAESGNPEKANMKSEKKILEIPGKSESFNGAEISFGPDGYLYISIGDDKSGNAAYNYEAQDLHSFGGKILRIDVKHLPYTIPADNPFVGVKNVQPEIWAYGFRKFWRYYFDPVSHQLIGGDVGEHTDEEIDIIRKGGNYGWPIKEGDSTYEKNNDAPDSQFVKPIYTYTHLKGICVIGGRFYYGKDLPALTNKYVFADWKGSLFALAKNKNEKWNCVPLKIVNKPLLPFFICGCFVDAANQFFVMGFLAGKSSMRGAIYKIVKA